MPPATVDPGAPAPNLECRIAERIPALPTLIVIGIGLLVPMPAGWLKHPVAVAMTGLAHVLIFALVTLFVYRRGPLSGHLTYSVVAVLLLGLGVEVVQPLVGRSASLDDVAFDAAGTLLAVAWIWRCRSGLRRPALLAVAVLAGLVFMLRELPGQVLAMGVVARNFPQLESFDDERALALWRPTYGAHITRQVAPADTAGAAGNPYLLLSSGPSRRWPGTVFHHFPRDWSGYRELVLSARVVGETALAAADTTCPLTPFCVRLDDIEGDRADLWFTTCLEAGQTWQEYRIDLRGLESNTGDRPLNLQEVLSVVIFLPEPAVAVRLAIDDLHLH